MDRQVYFSGGKALVGGLTNPGGTLADGDYVAPFALVVENGVITRVEQSWASDIDYTQDSLVLGSDCQLYRAVQASGPSSVAQDPTTDASDVYWTIFTSPVFPVWSPTVTYGGAGQSKFVEGSDGNIYRSQQGANTGHDPTVDNGTWWKLWYLVVDTTLNVGAAARFTTLAKAVQFVHGIAGRAHGADLTISIAAGATPLTVSAASNATPIQVDFSAAHGMTTGDEIFIDGVGGNYAANGHWVVTVVDSDTVTLDGSVGVAAYTSGGTGLKEGNFLNETELTEITNPHLHCLTIGGAGKDRTVLKYPGGVSTGNNGSAIVVQGPGALNAISDLTIIGVWENGGTNPSDGYGKKGIQAENGGTIYFVSNVNVEKFYYGVSATRGSRIIDCNIVTVRRAGDVAFWSYESSYLDCTSCIAVYAKDTQSSNNYGTGFSSETTSAIHMISCTARKNWNGGVHCLNSRIRIQTALTSSNNDLRAGAMGVLVGRAGIIQAAGTVACNFNGTSSNGFGLLLEDGGEWAQNDGSLTCNSNALDGIRATANNRISMTGSTTVTANSNGASGCNLARSSSASFITATFSSNTGTGLGIFNGSYITATTFTADANGSIGVDLRSRSYFNSSAATLTNNTSFGVRATMFSGAEVIGSTITGNNGASADTSPTADATLTTAAGASIGCFIRTT